MNSFFVHFRGLQQGPSLVVLIFWMGTLFLFGNPPIFSQSDYRIELTQTKIHTTDSQGFFAVIGGINTAAMAPWTYIIAVIDPDDQYVLQHQVISPDFHTFHVVPPKSVGSYWVGLWRHDSSSIHVAFDLADAVALAEFEFVDAPIITLDSIQIHLDDSDGILASIEGLNPDRDWDIQVAHLLPEGAAPIAFTWLEEPSISGTAEIEIPNPAFVGQYLVRCTSPANMENPHVILEEQSFSVVATPLVKSLPQTLSIGDVPPLAVWCFGLDNQGGDRLTLAAYGAPSNEFLYATWLDGEPEIFAFDLPQVGGLYELRLYENWSNRQTNDPVATQWVRVTGPPVAPTNLRVDNVRPTSISIEWDHPATCRSVEKRVERKDDYPGSPWQYVGSCQSSIYDDRNSFYDSGLDSETRYFYRVQACSTSGECSDYTGAISATTSTGPPRMAAIDLTVQSWNTIRVEIIPGSVDAAHGPADYFIVERERGLGHIDLIYQATSLINFDRNLDENERYAYTVIPVNEGGQGPESFRERARTPFAPPPSIPINLSGDALSGSRVALSWEPGPVNHDHAPADVVRISQAIGQGDFTHTETLFAETTSWEVDSLTPETVYRFRIRAYRIHGYSSSYSTPITVTTLAPSRPPNPRDLQITEAGFDTVQLSWERGNPTGTTDSADGFRVQRALGTGSFSILDEVAAGEGTAVFEDTTVEPETAYRYRIAAFNSGGVSGFSNEVTATTEPLPPVPDLTCSNPSWFYNGDPLSPRIYGFQVGITNLGTGVFPDSTTHFYLSEDAILDSDDTLLGTNAISVPHGMPNTAYNTQILYTFTVGQSGPKYILFKADGGEVVEETNENNNICVLPFTVPGDSGPDLWTRSGWYPSSNLEAGQSFTIENLGVQNLGNQPSGGASTLAIALSSHSNPPQQLVVMSTFDVPALAPGQIHDFGQVTVTIPEVVPTGSYFLIAWADFMTGNPNGQIIESDELNNWGRSLVQVQ